MRQIGFFISDKSANGYSLIRFVILDDGQLSIVQDNDTIFLTKDTIRELRDGLTAFLAG